jgi:hypothetical protein
MLTIYRPRKINSERMLGGDKKRNLSEIESSLASENESVMGAVIAVEVEAAGTAVTSTVGHRVTRDLLHQDVGETMTTIADRHREPQTRTSQVKQETTIDRLADVAPLPRADHQRLH